VQEISVRTAGERFYDITDQIQSAVKKEAGSRSGVVHLMLMHTSCGLCMGEAYDPSARVDMEEFLRRLAPRSQPFITHTAEGPDDSPSHMKSILMHQSITLIVDNGRALLGTWQGVYLCEFRDGSRTRTVTLKFMADH